MKLDEQDIDYQLLQKLEDRRYDRFSNTIKTIYGVFSIVFIVVGSLFAYLNATLVNRQEFSSFQQASTKETIALVEKEGGRLSNQINQSLNPVITQFTEVKNKFEESMNSFAIRMSAVERQVDQTKTEIDKSLFKTEDFYEFERENSRSLDALRDTILALQTKVAELKTLETKISDRYTKTEHNQYASGQTLVTDALNNKDDALLERLDSMRREMDALFKAVENRLDTLENNVNSYHRRK